jgi:hypothetical protein
MVTSISCSYSYKYKLDAMDGSKQDDRLCVKYNGWKTIWHDIIDIAIPQKSMEF